MIAWCPLEDDSNPEMIHGAGDFTAFVKVDVRCCESVEFNNLDTDL